MEAASSLRGSIGTKGYTLARLCSFVNSFSLACARAHAWYLWRETANWGGGEILIASGVNSQIEKDMSYLTVIIFDCQDTLV